MVPYGSILNPILVILTFLLGLMAFTQFIKIFKPEVHFMKILGDFILGL